MVQHTIRIAVALCLFACSAFADEAATVERFERLRQDPLLLRRFLEQMPKGGDLHNHLSGAAYAETYIRLGAADGLCVDTQRLAYTKCDPASTAQVPASKALTDSGLYTRLLDAMSMRQFRAIAESGHDHFFATFGKFSAVSAPHVPELLTEVVSRLAYENVDYLESLFGQDLGAARQLGRKFEPGTPFDQMRNSMLQSGDAANVVSASRKTIDAAEAYLRTSLECGTATAQAGCDSTVRYLFETHRAFPREQLFAELLVGFELAKVDSRVVGLNVVQPEDAYGSMSQFQELMRMFAYLRPLYPGVRISTHAGELAPGLVPPEGMRNHIRDSVLIANAERIGHGVDIARETDALALLRTMAARPVAVEVCLTSNDVILGVTGKQHPLRLYLRSDVPVVLGTDDPGVARTDMTTEWQRAVEDHGVSYADLKRFARNSIEFSFIEGGSLWRSPDYRSHVAACTDRGTDACKAYLDANPKARVQMRLEQRLREFEDSELR
ncbi:MAG TPA: adenosine deaminase [Thermoanaerobaculia bacterium]|nr:adenosine deaminase [Thermoanaerobaculia bacterium]